MSPSDWLPWEWFLAAGGMGCAGGCGLLALATIATVAWRITRRPVSEPTSQLPVEGPETRKILTTVLAYRRTADAHRERERWGRPIRYTRDASSGACWSTPVDGYTLSIIERKRPRDTRVIGIDPLDARFQIESDMPLLETILGEPELRDRLIALPWVQLEADGTRIRFTDSRLQAHSRACSPHDPESAEGLAMQVRLHDAVCDLLVMLADRLG